MCYVVGKDISHALDDSIELWETLTQEDNSFFLKYVHGCPLCETTSYYRGRNCDSCPITWDTGEINCVGTVFYKTRAWLKDSGSVYYDVVMLMYLKDLRHRLDLGN